MAQSSSSVFDQIENFAQLQARNNIDEFILPAHVIPHFKRNGVRPEEIENVIGSSEDLDRRIKLNSPLTADQTDRASRLAHIVSLSEKVFQSREKSFFWLRKRNRYLNEKTPLECISREAGARLVEEALLRIEYGIAS